MNTKSKPNIIVFFTDQQRWDTSGLHGNPLSLMENFDHYAVEGTHLYNSFTCQPVCGPARASLQSGMYATKTGCFKNRIPLKKNIKTLAKYLSKEGYATGYIGKWHLSGPDGNAIPAEYMPTNHGFDINIAGNSRGGPGGENSFFDPYTILNIENRKEGEYLPDRLADEAIDYMTTQKELNNPFFLCLWNYTVHWPIEAPDHLYDKYAPNGKPNLHQKFQAMVEGMDAAIGKVLTSLDELGLAENTLVVFTSDNGPFTGDITNEITSTKPLKEEKGYLGEGGIRVPLIIRWPGKIKSGTVSNVPVVTMDFVPTFLDAAKKEFEEGEFDGESLLPLLTENKALKRSSIYFHYPHYAFHRSNKMGSVIRTGDFKLIYYH